MDLEASLRTIIEAVDPAASIQGHQQLSGGLSYELRRIDTDRGRFVVREANNMRAGRWGLSLADEYELIRQLNDTPVPAPTTRLFDDSGTVLKHPFALYDYIEGAPLLHSKDHRLVGRQVAEALFEVHSTPLDSLNTSPLPHWSTFAGSIIADDPTVFDANTDEQLVRSTLREHWPPPEPADVSLLHGDFWPGNLIARDGEIVGVLDWENAAIGDPVADIAVVRLDLLWCYGPTAAVSFLSHYRTLGEVDLYSLAVWDLFAALRPAGDLHQWAEGYPGLGRPDITFDTMQAGHRWFVSQALAALSRPAPP